MSIFSNTTYRIIKTNTTSKRDSKATLASYAVVHRSLNVVFLLLVSCWAFGQSFNSTQPKDNSPYSRLGIGDLVNQNFAAAAGFGGLSASYHDPYHLNILNPASLAYLQSTAFEIGFYSEYSKLESGDSSDELWNGNLNYLAVGFPIKNPINDVLGGRKSDFNWGASLSLTPYSRVGYDLRSEGIHRDTIELINSFRGNGGTYKFTVGNGISYKNFSFGVNLGALFGKISNAQVVALDNLSAHYYYDDFLEEYSINGFVWNVGAQYQFIFGEIGADGIKKTNDKSLTVGVYGNSRTDFTVNSSQLFVRIPVPTSSGGYFAPVDTINNVTDVIEKGKLPAEFNLGLMYQKTNKFKLGLNAGFANWSNYENPAQADLLENSYKFSVGGEIIPDIISYNRYLKRVRYRFGAFYGNDPRSFDGEQLTEYGLTLGLGLPIVLPRQQTSFVNFAVEAGKFGAKNGLNETYVRMTLGFTLNDNSWFFKRRFN